jgi:hypothetical protein
MKLTKQIIRLLAVIGVLMSSALVAVAPMSAKTIPKPLLEQVQRLTELLRDSCAVWYPDATMVQFAKVREGEELVLTVFTIEGFGGGNNHAQFFAVFTVETSDKGKQHFSLLDVMPIAGKGWRSVRNLNAKVTKNPESKEIFIAFEGLEVAVGDAMNFPTKKITINLLLKDGRIVKK